MALEKQQIPLSFIGGIDTKTDDKQVIATKLLELENGVFSKRGQIRKRSGYDILLKRILGSTDAIDSATGISTFKDELVLFTGTKLYSYLEAPQSWKEKGTVSSVTIQNRSVIRNIYQQMDPDYAYNSGLSCYVWKDSSNGCRYTVIDEESGTVVSENQLLSSTAISPRVVGVGRYFFIYYIENTTLKFKYIQISTPNLISTSVDITTKIDPSDKIYDTQKVGDRVYIAYNSNNGSTSTILFYMTSNKTVSSEVEYIGEEAKNAISICEDSSQNIWVSYSTGTAVRYFIQNYELTAEVLSPSLIETISSVRNISSIESDTNMVTFLYEVTHSPANYTKKSLGELDGTVTGTAVFVRSVGLASKFFEYNSEKMVTLTHQSTLQSTYYIYTLSGDIVTKSQQGVGGGLTSSSILPTVIETSSGKFVLPTLKKGILQTENGVVFTSLGISSTLIDFTALNNFITAEIANSLHVVGGILQSYDGSTITETGFSVFPEGVAATETNTGAGVLSNGTYNYAVVYAWVDNQGQIHRSAPSLGPEIAVASGPSDVQLTIPTLRITKKSNVFIEVYRTELNGTIYYKVTSNTSLTANDPTVDTITYNDTMSDATLISGELLYTTGGVLDNICPPSSSVIVNWKNRLVLKSSDDENILWYSKLRQENFPVEFTDAFTITVDPVGGDITALGVLDDKLIIFKKSQIFVHVGDGPNNLGEQSDFGNPERLATDVGCTDVNSVVQTPVGVLFKSAKGIYLLDRGLQAQYIGSEVEAFNSSRITAARLVPDVNQVRFTTESGLCLVYDYFFGQWSTFTNHEAVGATTYQDKFCFVKSDGRLFKENSSVYTDGAEAVKMKLVSSWIQPAAIEGFQRVYKFLLLGQYKSSHRLRVKVGFDFESAFTQETVIDVDSVLDPTAYGDSSPYGAEDLYGGKFPLYQWRVFPKRQKCQALRICIEDIMDDTFGESFNISSMRFEVGIKQGSNKLDSSKSFPTS
jgi:hypothetical protein